ncbi:hypothetical protein FORC065_4058 [Yersinia enterocolitica]|nr:hypothetical protein FORC065_4058 [Yersinia enterocolitica]
MISSTAGAYRPFFIIRPYFLSDVINALLQIIICKTEQHPAQS